MKGVSNLFIRLTEQSIGRSYPMQLSNYLSLLIQLPLLYLTPVLLSFSYEVQTVLEDGL